MYTVSSVTPVGVPLNLNIGLDGIVKSTGSSIIPEGFLSHDTLTSLAPSKSPNSIFGRDSPSHTI